MVVVPKPELRDKAAERVTEASQDAVFDSPVPNRMRPWRELYHIVIQSSRRELDFQAS